MPENVSQERTQLLQAFGAEIIYTPGDLGSNGAIAHAKEIVEQNPGKYYFPYQYGNEANPRAHYETTGPEILRDLPQTTAFVAGLGTGGTLTGTGHYLKDHKPAVRVIAAAPHPGDMVQGLRALEDGFIPPILDESVLDGKIVVDSQTSFAMSRELTEKEGLFVGVSCRLGRAGGASRRPSAWRASSTSFACWPTAAGSTSRATCGRPTGRTSRTTSEHKIWW